MLLFFLLAPPLVAASVAAVVAPDRRWVGWFNVAAASVSFAASAAAALVSAPYDALSALLAVCIAFVLLLVSALGPGLGDEHNDPAARRFSMFINAFAVTMLYAVTVQNVALMWVAIEATTITSAVLIPLRRTRGSVEASWKYILICSVGIALAFAGTVLAYFDFVATAGQVRDSLNWSVLRNAAPSLHPQPLQLAFAFILVGYGTKAGLAPMHTWLPDAYSEAPSPISAMMSGVLSAVALYAIARWKAVIDGAVDPEFTTRLLTGFGLASVIVGALSLVIQRHYKRMLAYSSIEHIGLVSIGFALGPAGVFAGWLHVVNHAVAKSMSFLLAGRILHRYDTAEIGKVRGLLLAMPWTGALFAAGVLALVGLPPFGLFISEFLLVRAAVAGGHMWIAAAILVLLVTAFISLIGHLNRMLYGDVPPGVPVGERAGWPQLALAGSAAVLVVLGLTLPRPVSRLIDQCVALLS
jgi:hydrogenase-4 component F